MAFRNYILLFALVAGTVSVPINVQDGDSKCSTKCEASLSDSGKFDYTVGHTYTYTYEGKTETRLHGSSEQWTNLKIQATADIEVLSKCEYALKLSDVSLIENDRQSRNSNDFKQRLEAKPLRFAFQDGVIENICSTTGEDERVLNIKRAVLSTFQNSMKQLDKDGLFTETDVSGTCPTTYTSKSGLFGGAITVTKTKDILACTERTGNITAVHSETYNVPSKLQNAPLLSSTHKCEQDIKHGQIQKTMCNEVLMFRPFSKDGNGAVTKASQTLTFSTYKRSISLSETAVQKRSSMLFHHLYDESTDSNAKSEVIGLLQEICTEVGDDIQKSTPIRFGELISKMKRLDTNHMMQVYQAVNGGRICSSLRGKQFFYDAVPVVFTEASLSLAKKLITDKTVQGFEADVWLTELAFIPRPTSAMLAVVKPLLTDATFSNKALLGISAMVHKICEQTPNCHTNEHVADFVTVLTANIGSDCMSTTAEQRKTMMLTLKAIGNAGKAFTSSSIIGRCITNQNVDTEVRVAALQAFRRMPCTVSREDAMRMYQNAQHDSELRIHAFLAIMSCPTTRVLTSVRMMLGGEPVNQVGSFVWTYLENLKETSSPLRQELSSILDDAKLRQDFNLDARKYSRNLEKSFFSDYLNAGAQIESNLIWSQRSYIPRSAMLNLTIDMFGDSVNLVELGGRVQGLEKIVEKFFGPNGYFGKKNVQELMDNKRQTANYISSFDNAFKTPEDKILTSLYVKMFGNEIRFSELDSSEWTDIKNFNVLDFLIKLAEPKKIDLTKNMQLMDSSLIVPTCVGLPMNLTVNGTASVSVDVDGNVDLRNVATSPRSFDISGHIKPSAAIVVSGMMGVDAIVTKSSMKMVSTMHTSTQIDGKITLQNGEIFNIELNTPQEKIEVFHVQTEFFMNGLEMTMPEPAKVYKKCTPAGVTKVIGMEMCVDVTLPTFHKEGLPLPPFTGPMNAQVFIEKKDTHSGYAFTAKLENDKQEVSGMSYTKRLVHVSLDTPGSQVDRKLLVEGLYDLAAMRVSAQIESPWKKFDWNASLDNTLTLKKAQSTFVIDKDQTYSAVGQVDIKEMSAKTVYSPSFSITVPNKPVMSVSGTFQSGSSDTIAAVDLAIKNFSRKPITLTSSLSKTNDGATYSYIFDLKSDMLTSKITSSVSVAPGNYNGKGEITYSMEGRPEHRITAYGKLLDNSRGELMSYSMKAGVVPTEYPQFQFNIDSSLDMTANHIDTSLDIELNKQKMSIAHKTIKEGSMNALKIQSSSSFKYPNQNIDMSAKIDHEHNADVIKHSGAFSYGGKTVTTGLNFDKSVPDRYTGDVSLGCPHRDVSFSADVRKLMDGEHKIVMKTQWGNDADSQASLTSTWMTGETHKINGDVQIPGHPISLSVTLKPNPQDFMCQTDVTYNKNTYSLKSSYKLTDTTFTTSCSWNSPNKAMSYQMDLSSNSGKMAASTEFSWAPNQKMMLSGEYNNRDTSSMISRDSKLTVTMPTGTHSMSSEFEFSPNNYCKVKSELSLNGARSVLSGRYSLGSGELSLDSPYIRFGEVKSVDIKLNHASGSADVTVTWAPSKQVFGEVKWSDVKYSAAVTSPFAVSKFGGSVELPTAGKPSIRGYWNNDEASLTVSYPDMNKGDFTLAYPGHTVTGSFSQNGNMENFVGESEVAYDGQKFWSKLAFSTSGPVTLTLDINTPLDVKKISASFSHQGTLMSFTNDATLSWDAQRVHSSVKFSGKEAEISVNTPWRDVLGKYTVKGDMSSFTANTLMRWAADQQISADVTFDMQKDVTGSFTIKSPFYDTVSGSLEHKGQWNDFTNMAKLTWTPTDTFSATTRFSMTNGVSLQFDVETPQKTSLSVTHNGGLAAWNNKAELTISNKAPMTLYSEFSYEQLKGKMGIKGVPSESFQSGEFSIDGTKYTNKLDLESTLTWNEKQSISASMKLSRENGYHMSCSLSTPYTETYSMETSHKWTPTTLLTTTSVQWAPNMKISTELDISNGISGLAVKTSVNTPWRQVSYALNQHGNSDEFMASSKFSWETGKEMSSTIEFSRLDAIVLKWTLNTPFEDAKSIKASLTHRGSTPLMFNNQLEGSYNGQEAKVRTEVAIKSQSAKITILSENPWKNININLQRNGVATDFTASADLTMDSTTYHANTKFAYKDSVVFTFDATPVIYKPISLSAELGWETNTASLKWGDNQVISGTASLKFNENMNTMDALVKFSTPFEGYESGEATVKHSGTWESFRETINVSFNSESAKLEGGFSSTGDIKGDFTLSSPWYNSDGRFEHSGDMNRFTNSIDFTYAAGKTIRASSKWNMANGIDAEITFNAPFKSFNAKYNHGFSLSKELTGHAEFTLDETRMLNSDITFRNSPSNINLVFSVNTPLKSFSGKYSHVGTMQTRCNAEAEFTWDSQTVGAEWSVSMANGFSTDVTVRSPWRNFSGEVKHTMTSDSFDNTVSITYETGKTITLATEFGMNPDILVKSTFTSPFKNANIMYRHSGSLENFNCHLTGAYGEVPIVANLRWSAMSGYETSFDLTSPWKNIKGSFKTTTDVTDLVSSATFEWGTEKMESSLKFNTLSGYQGEVDVKSPWRNMSAKFDVTGELTDFESNASVSWETGKSISAKVSSSLRKGSVELVTPWRTISANHECQGTWENFNSVVDFSWETGKKITLTARSDSRSGLDTEWKLDTPWRVLSTKVKYDPSYNMEANVSWESGKSISMVVRNTMTDNVIDSSVTVNTPWRIMSASWKMTGQWTKFDSTSEVSWTTGKSIKMETSWDMETKMSGSTTVTTPYRVMSAKFNQVGDLMKFDGDYEISWEAGKKMSSTVSFNRQNGWESKFTVNSPWKNIETNAKFIGKLTAFTSGFDITWEAGKSISTTAAFSLEPFTASWTWKCLTYDMSAEVKHTGSAMDFSNSANFSWEPTKRIELSSAFKNADVISGRASVKSPFDANVDLSFEHTASSGELSLVQPFMQDIKAEYTYTDMYNFNGKVSHGTQDYTGKAVTTWNNGLQTNVEVSSPDNKFSIDIDHQGDFSTFKNTVEAKWNAQTYKLTSTCNLDQYMFSQDLTTPFMGYESLKWSASFTPTDTSLQYRLAVSKNTDSIEVDFNGKMEQDQTKTVITSTMEFSTPFEGVEKNKLTDVLEYSSQFVHVKSSGYIGSPANARSMEIYSMLTGLSADVLMPNLNSYVKVVDIGEESMVSFTFTMDEDKVTSEYNADVKFYPAMNAVMKFDATHSHTDAAMNHQASLTFTRAQSTKKFTWNSGSNSNMCETSFTYMVDGTDKVAFTHKTTWITDYQKLSHDMTLKVDGCDKLKDCEFKFDYDFTQDKKTVNISLFNDPTAPFDFKSEVTMGDSSSFMVELSTPFEAVKIGKTTVTVNKAAQPWTVNIQSQLNQKSVTAEGRLSYTSPMVFDVSSSFTSQIPMYENLMMSMSSSATQDQWKPHASFQWASDKKMDLGATISWSNQYKATVEFSSPFENWRSVSMDATANNQLPTSYSGSFEMNANQLSSKIASQLSYNMDTKSFTYSLNTPFETVNSLDISATMKPRINTFIKLNGENMFTLTGNAQVESLTKHNIDLTVTYPFWNEFIRFKLDCDFDPSDDNMMNCYSDLEYMRGKEISLKFDHKSGESNTLSISLETPFEKFEKTSYSLVYTGTDVTKWTESTEFEYYYGKVTSRSSFSLENGITFHRTVTGQMKNGIENFDSQQDLVFTGDTKKFDVQANMAGSFMPSVKFETSWQYDPTKLSLKSTFNKYNFEYIHTGPRTDFTCAWKMTLPVSSDSWFSSDSVANYVGTWSFKNSDELMVSADITTPEHHPQFKLTLGKMKGSFDGSWKHSDETLKNSWSYSLTEAPFRYESSGVLEVPKVIKFSSNLVLTENSINFPITVDDKEWFSLRANNPINADDEYVPTLEIVTEGKKYEFDGLYKNEGSGLVRDFKLHLNGPRGSPRKINYQFEFKTQSAQLVPGDLKYYLSFTDSENKEHKLLDMDASWGNDHALFTFRNPQPMRYSLDFSVSTTGQSGVIEANWDTTSLDKNCKIEFTNKYSSSSSRLTSNVEIDVLYTGISRDFVSSMDWQTNSFEHKLTLGYNGKKIGYDVTMSESSGMSMEIITQWRNVKVTWNRQGDMSGNMEGTLGLYWDSSRDLTKRFLGTSKVEKTAENTYKWTTTVSHPYLVKDIVITDTVAYDTSSVYFTLNKLISFSPDTSKNILCKIVVEKNGKWGVELKQDFNKVDIRVGSEFTSTGIKSTAQYKAANGSMKMFGLLTSYDASSKTGMVQMTSPMKTIKLESTATSTTYTISLTVDGEKYSSAFTYRPELSSMLIRMGCQHTDVEFEAKRLTGGYQVQLSKTAGDKTTVEGLAAISMNESNIINGKLQWNPALISEIQTKIASVRSALKDTVKTMHTAARAEVTNKVNGMQLGGDFKDIMPRHNTEMQLLQTDIDAAMVMIGRGYEQDVFFMKSIDEATSGYISMMWSEFAVVQTKIMDFYTMYVEPRLETLGEDMEQAWLDLSNKLTQIELRIQDCKNRAITEWNEQTEFIREDMEVVAEWFQAMFARVSKFIAEHPTMETLKSAHGKIMNQFTALSDATYGKVVVIADPQLYTDAIYSAHSYVNNAIMNSPVSSSMLTGLSDSLMYKLKFYYEYYDVSDNIKIFLTHVRNVAKEYLSDYLTHYIDQTLNDFKWVAYNLNQGHVEFEFVVPTALDKINMMGIKTDLMQRLTNAIAHVRKCQFDLKEMFYMYEPSTFKQILPPFDAQAIIAGQHIRTFDRRHYDFSSGKCSYLLARDFHDGNFTVFVNYNGEEQSLTVHSNGKTIDIQQDNSVKMDGSKIELPHQFFNTSITRMGSKIALISTLGVKVICDNEHGLCTVDMSGHYFAKTGGLFGTYNYEPRDDFTTSQNTNTSDVLAFANSWTKSCVGTNTAKSFNHVEGTKEYSACAVLLKNSESPLSSCFSTVKPDQAFHKCITDMSTDVTLNAANGPCKAAMFYKAQCQFAGIEVNVPSQCVSCNVNGINVEQGRPMKLTEPVMAADVVFVVEEKMCNYEMDIKLPALAKLIESSLSRNSFSNIRFGLVGFGGQGVHSPSHIHTMDSKLLAPRTELARGLNALKFSSAGNNKDVFDAIDFAAQYPFRAGASKVVIVLPCSNCGESKLSYRSIAERLNTEDITVHVINDFSYDVTVEGKNPASNYLFGIDNHVVYTVRDIRSVRGTARLYPIISKPSDYCSELALQTGGTVFDMNMMTKMSSNIIKSFQTVFANRLALTTTPSRCTSCVCEYNPLFMMSRAACNKC